MSRAQTIATRRAHASAAAYYRLSRRRALGLTETPATGVAAWLARRGLYDIAEGRPTEQGYALSRLIWARMWAAIREGGEP